VFVIAVNFPLLQTAVNQKVSVRHTTQTKYQNLLYLLSQVSVSSSEWPC